jgi:hypothetical protein
MALPVLDLPATRFADDDRIGVDDGVAADDGERPSLRQWRWPYVVAVVAYVQYAIASVWMMEVRDFALGDALSRTATAKIMVSSRDPHLASWGFYWMPLPTVARVPLVLLLDPFGKAQLAGPLTSSLFTAASIPVVAAIGRALRLRTGVVVVVTLLYAINPVGAFSAVSGMSESTFVCFASLALLGTVRYLTNRDPQSLALTGLALAMCMASRYETLVLAPCWAAALAATAPRPERRNVGVLVLLPPAIVFVLWSFASLLIQDDALFWWNYATGFTDTPPGAAWLPSRQTATNLLAHSLTMMVAVAPALMVLVVAVPFVGRRRLKPWFVVASISWIVPIAVTAQLVQGTSWGVPRFYFPEIVFGVTAVLWLLHVAVDEPRVRYVAWLGLAALAASTVSGAWHLADKERTIVEGEHVLLAPFVGKDGAPAELGDGRQIQVELDGYEPLMAVIEPRLADGQRLAMDTINALPFLKSSHPRQFIIPEDRDSEIIASDPVGRIDLILLLGDRVGSFGSTLRGIVQADPDWVLIDSGGVGELYEYQGEVPA